MNAVSTFQYEQLDAQTAQELRSIESELEETLNQFAARLGGIIKKAQDVLAKNGYGCFSEWLSYVGIPRRTAYEYIDIHDLFVRTAHNRRGILESIPKKLLVQVSAKSSESTPAKAQAKAEVLDGKIDTLKKYKERIAELEAQTQQAESARRQAEQRAEIAEEKSDRYERLFGDAGQYDASTTKVTNGDAITYAVYSFQEDVRNLVEKYSHLTHFRREFDEMIDEGRDEYLKALNTLGHFIGSIERMLKTKDAIIIEQ